MTTVQTFPVSTGPARSPPASEDHPASTGPATRRLLAFLAAIGRPVVTRATELSRIVAIVLAVLWQSLRPLTWRRPARAELARQCHLAGLGNLKTVCALAVLIGIGLVYQSIYWLELAGQGKAVGQFLAFLLIREIAPIVAAVVVIGRHGAAVTAELANLRGNGQVGTMDALGLDPLHVLLVPRAVAMSICLFCLAVAFVILAFVSGYVCARAFQVIQFSPAEFASNVLGFVGLEAYAAMVLKTILIGLLAGVICCQQGLDTDSPEQVSKAVALGYGKSLLAAFIVSGAITMLI